MKLNQWTLGLAAAGVISLGSVVQAEEAQHQVMTALSSTTLSGYVDTSAIWHFGYNGALAGRSFDWGKGSIYNKADGFNLDVVSLSLEKPLEEGQWAAGYNVNLLFGPDANIYDTSSMGFTSQDFAIKDANITLRAPLGNGLDLKMGYWESPVGYEVFDSYKNPNFSRSFGYYIEPKQFTGLLASYRFNEMLAVAGGVANSSSALAFPGPNAGNWINDRAPIDSLKSYLAHVALTAPESAGFLKGATVYAGVIDTGLAARPDIVNWYVGGTLPTPMTGLTVGAAYDYRASSAGNGFNSSHAWTLAGYLSYQATEKLKINNRLELADGSNGIWYATPVTSKNKSNSLLGYTLTADYSLWANVVTRAELRWDHELNGNGIFNGPAGNMDKNALSLALNVIYKF